MLRGKEASGLLDEVLAEFSLAGVGIRPLIDREWITTAETCEFALALDALGRTDEAELFFDAVQHLRASNGLYALGFDPRTGVEWPVGTEPSWVAATVLLCSTALGSPGPAAGLFRGEGLPFGITSHEIDDILSHAERSHAVGTTRVRIRAKSPDPSQPGIESADLRVRYSFARWYA
jgi:hypothetical protein